MTLFKYLSLCAIACSLLIACKAEDSNTKNDSQEHVLSNVDPFIGTGLHGHAYPGATVPFGAVQLSPDNGTEGWDWCSGYNWDDDTIVGFSHTHLSGTGIGDLYDLSTMPTTGGFDISDYKLPKESSYASKFDHKNETAHPGYYKVKLDNGIEIELTASTHAGYHKITYPTNAEVGHLLDLGFNINWDKPTLTKIEKIDDYTLVGQRNSTGWAKDQRIFFAMRYSQPIASFSLADSSAIITADKGNGLKLRAYSTFENTQELEIQMGISTADVAGALKAIEKKTTFTEAKEMAEKLWIKEFDKISITGINDDITKSLQTAFYRTCLAPIVMSDANGRYKGVDGKIQTTKTTRYDILSLWDTFRAANPLHTIVQSDKVNDVINSMLAHYDQSGLLPVWSLLGNETNTMTGYHSIPVIADAYLKGFDGFDANKALVAMVKSANQDIRGTDLYRKYGFIPYGLDGQSVTKTLEYAYDDWCIATMADKMGKTALAEQFYKRSKYYQNMFDPKTKFMRGRLPSGDWKVPFDPQFSDHDWNVAEYTEGNAWQHSWFVPHDPQGLINLHGGDESFNQKLDSLFTVDSTIKGDNASVDISGLIGQYAHGNEPSHHIAYLYNYTGTPYKSQKILDSIMVSQYNTTPYGLCGNEDCGQMSAWYVFSGMGFYPVNPAQGIYVLGRPMIKNASINLGNGRSFDIRAKNNSLANKYIDSVTLNGETLSNSYITHQQIMNGGELVFEMTNIPNKNWAAAIENRPPSMTKI